MRTWLAIGIGVVGLSCLQVAGAVAADSGKQDKGIVNERSTGNEPFTGPGASGGPMHSAPGATERTIQDSTKADSGMGKGEKGASSKGDQSKKSGASGGGR
jgi:hypothetical protein